MHLSAVHGQQEVERAQQGLRDTASQIKEVDLAPEERSSDSRMAAANWPERTAIGALTQTMGEQAIVNALALRTLAVSHTELSDKTWGRVDLEMMATGRYADLKNWQSGLLARFPSLAVQSLRLQPMVAGPMLGVGVEAQMRWVLYVRD